jgi:hypothetical protein
VDENAAPLLTVINGVFASGEAHDRFEVVLHAAVHGWMEGHVAAPGHRLAAATSDEEMPVPPYPSRDSEALREILAEAMDRFGDDEEPAVALFAAALGWRAGRQEGLDCTGCALIHADQPIARAIRDGTGRYEFHLGRRAPRPADLDR